MVLKDVVVGALTGLCSSQPAVHVATASASHRNEWHAPGSTGHGAVPTMPGTPLVPAILQCLV